MELNKLMQQKNITKYRLSKDTGIPYTTLSDICSGKAQLEKCTVETVYKLARKLDVSMESLLAPHMEKRPGFDLFKSNVCHQVKEQGDIDFIIHALEDDRIRSYFERGWYFESLYLLAMLDYLSRLNHVPLCTRYDDLRHSKLSEVVYPSSVLVAAAVAKSDRVKKQSISDAIPEFMRFNIVENEVRNVI